METPTRLTREISLCASSLVVRALPPPVNLSLSLSLSSHPSLQESYLLIYIYIKKKKKNLQSRFTERIKVFLKQIRNKACGCTIPTSSIKSQSFFHKNSPLFWWFLSTIIQIPCFTCHIIFFSGFSLCLLCHICVGLILSFFFSYI